MIAAALTGAVRASDFSSDDAGWRHYQRAFVSAEGRVIDTGNEGISHSEGQGWAMIMAVAFDDRPTFERLWRWTRTHLKPEADGLIPWRYDPKADPPVKDRNNASDGDLLIAWALDRAGRRWDEPRYNEMSEHLRTAIVRHLVRRYAGYTVLLPARDGFHHDGRVHLNLSYLVMPALRRFHELEPDGPWRALARDGRRLLSEGRFGEHRLPPDWLSLADDGTLSPAGDRAPRFGFEGVRVPLYFVWGEAGRSPGLDAIAGFWRRQDAPPAWVDVTNGDRADYPLSRGALAIRALLLERPSAIPASPKSGDDYYSASLLMLSRVAADETTRVPVSRPRSKTTRKKDAR